MQLSATIRTVLQEHFTVIMNNKTIQIHAVPLEKSKCLSDNMANVKRLVKGTSVIAYEFECFGLPIWLLNKTK